MTLLASKASLRTAALAARKAAFAAAQNEAGQSGAARSLARALAPWSGRVLAGYMPVRSEIDPRPVMRLWPGPVAVPVIDAAGLPLRFRQWTPDCAMTEGAFGIQVPAAGEWLEPGVVIVPLVAWDRRGCRLGYGGGFYDRTLAALRQCGTVIAAGFAFDAQELPEIPVEPTDQRLDLLVTETRVLRFG